MKHEMLAICLGQTGGMPNCWLASWESQCCAATDAGRWRDGSGMLPVSRTPWARKFQRSWRRMTAHPCVLIASVHISFPQNSVLNAELQLAPTQTGSLSLDYFRLAIRFESARARISNVRPWLSPDSLSSVLRSTGRSLLFI